MRRVKYISLEELEEILRGALVESVEHWSEGYGFDEFKWVLALETNKGRIVLYLESPYVDFYEKGD